MWRHITILLLLWPFLLSAQEKWPFQPIKVFGNAFGFKQPLAGNIVQDRHGFLWTGTDNGGLFRFDGASATHWDIPGEFDQSVSGLYYDSLSNDLWAGPLNLFDGSTTANNCSNWDRIFQVSDQEIRRFLDSLPELADHPSLAISQFRNIMGWPGRNNPYFSSIWGFDLPGTGQTLAFFFDYDNDGQYNPLKGDYPAVGILGAPPFVPEFFSWCVFNDVGHNNAHEATGGVPLNLEVQLTTWSFNCPDQPVLNNTVFTAHKLIRRSSFPIDSCYAGLFTDFELGCYADDRVGCAPGMSTFYAYNSDAVDGDAACTGATFGANPPIQSVTILNTSLDKFMSFGNATSGTPPAATNNPVMGSAAEHYGALTGSWRNGKKLTLGGTGYKLSGGTPTDYAFPGNPNNSTEWSMCSANIAGADRRVLGSHKIGKFLPNQVQELVTAWTYHPLANYTPCVVDSAMEQIAELRNQYAQGFSSVCKPVVATREQKPTQIPAFPNPASTLLTLQYQDLDIQTITCYSSLGNLVLQVNHPAPQQSVLDVSAWENGIYWLNFQTKQGVSTLKVCIQNP